jgi:hypothetical protein
MRRLFVSLSVLALVTAFAAPRAAYAQQSFSIYAGGFVPRGEDARSDDDVLVNDLNVLAFNIDDFKGFTFGGEWMIGLTNFAEAGLGVGYYRRTVPSVYADQVQNDGSEIEQDLRLRIVPVTATVRLLPLGRQAAVQPYIGGGVGIFGWRYSEAGEFVDDDGFIFRDRSVGSGATAGPVILGGIRFPAGSWDIGGEIRWQSAQGELPEDEGFFGSEIDLGGVSYLATFNIRF